MKKKRQLYWFFKIENSTEFKAALHTDISPILTSTTQLLDVSTQPITAVNIAFSQRGLNALNFTEDVGDPSFSHGQIGDVEPFHDRVEEWVPAFKSENVHGVLMLASDTTSNIDAQLLSIEAALHSSATKVYSLEGAARPGSYEGHEHFGFADGISQPYVKGFGTALPGQESVDPGQFLLGEEGDPLLPSRPSWSKDGSFLAFRQLQQFVPEFKKFLLDNPTIVGSMTPEEGSVFTGARMVGRWKSGAPLALAPLSDDLTLAADPTRNNNFNFSEDEDFIRCPFSAHIRKTAPRDNLPTAHILRSGIPYGPEVTDEERALNVSATDPALERGLAFVAYQSFIPSSFAFIQAVWANNPDFHVNGTGLDPIVGTNGGSPFEFTGIDPYNVSKPLTVLQDFVVSRGGEYFFAPSISAVRDILSV
ncbi:DyP-type peroxidase [Flagelloscypha sp. PMI_526]|nr:DyP-type peroxidase [Flagelloscypha sp. PMI_526]